MAVASRDEAGDGTLDGGVRLGRRWSWVESGEQGSSPVTLPEAGGAGLVQGAAVSEGVGGEGGWGRAGPTGSGQEASLQTVLLGGCVSNSSRPPSWSRHARLSLLLAALVHLGSRDGDGSRARLHGCPPKDTLPLLGRPVIPSGVAAGVGVHGSPGPGLGARGPLWRGRWDLFCCSDCGTCAPGLGQPRCFVCGQIPSSWPRGSRLRGTGVFPTRTSSRVLWVLSGRDVFDPRVGLLAVSCGGGASSCPLLTTGYAWPPGSEHKGWESWGTDPGQCSLRLHPQGRGSDPLLLPLGPVTARNPPGPGCQPTAQGRAGPLAQSPSRLVRARRS